MEGSQVAVSQESLTVEVTLDIKGAEQGFNALNKKLNEAEDRIISMSGSLKVTEKELKKTGDAAEKAGDATEKAFGGTANKSVSSFKDKVKSLQKSMNELALPLLAVNQAMELTGRAIQIVDQTIGKAVRSFIELESSVARINTLIPEAERGMYDFAEAIREQQSAFGTDVATAGKAYYEAIASGAVDAAGAITLMDTAQKLAIGGVTTLDTAVNALTTVMSSYGIAAEEASKISDILFIAAAGGKTDIEQLAKQMGDVVGIAKAAGVSFGEVASAVSAVTAAGQPTAIAVTGVRAAISELLTPTKELQFALKNLGIENVEAAIAQKGFVGVLREVADAYGGNATALAALFARIESLPALTALVSKRVGGQFDDMNRASKDAMDGMVSNTENAFGVMAVTVEQRMARARGAIDAEMSRIGKIFSEGFGPATASMTESFQEILELTAQLARVIVPILGAIASAINTLLIEPLAKAAEGWKLIISGIFWAEEALKGLFRSSEAAAAAAAKATQEASKNSAPAPEMPSINQAAVREAVASLEKLREQTKGLAEATLMVGKTQQEQARIERTFRLQQLDDTEKQLKAMGLLGGLNQKTLEEARKGINAYYAALEKQGALEDLKKKTEEQKRALEEQMRAIEGIGRAYLALGATVQKLADAYEMLQFDGAQLASTPVGQQVDAIERAYQVTLRQIEAEKQKSIASGVSLKAIEDQLSTAVDLANVTRDQARINEAIAFSRNATAAAEEAAEQGLKSLRAQRMTDNESLLRIGMSRMELADRELQVEMDKIEALEAQLKASEKLDRFAKAELDLARRTAQEKNKNAKAQIASSTTPTEAVGIGGAAAAATSLAGSGSPVGAFMAAAEMIVGIVQKLIDFIPNILNAIAKIFSSVADLPNMILKAVTNVISGIAKFTSEFIPNLFKAIPEIIEQILTAAFETLPAAAQKLFEQLPSLIEGLLDKVPDLVAKFVEGIVSNAAVIAIGLIRALIQNLPAFFKAIVLFMPRILLALAKGIVQGIANAFKNIGGALKGVGTGIATGFQEGLKKLTGFKSNVFGITEDVLSGPIDTVKSLIGEAEKAGRSIWDALVAAIKAAWGWLMGIGKQIWEGMKAAVSSSWEFVKSIGKVLWEGAVSSVSTIWEALKSAGKVLWEGVVGSVSTIWEALKTAGTYIWQGLKALFSGNGSEAMQKFKEAGAAIWNGLKELWDSGVSTLTSLGKVIWDGFKALWDGGIKSLGNLGSAIWDGFKSAWNSTTSGFMAILNKLNPANLFGKIFGIDPKQTEKGKGGKVENWLGVNLPFIQFSKGGFVPGRATVMGDSTRNDTVPALVSPGEAIIPRSIMQDPSVAKLIAGILGGKKPEGFASGGLIRVAKAVVTGGASEAAPVVKSAIQSAQEVFSGMSADVKAGWNFIQSLGAKVDLIEFVKNPLAYATKIFKSAIDPFFKGQLDKIMGGIFQANKFATGGMVAGSGSGDTVPAMLAPGEFVMRRSAVDSIGAGALAQMNRTGASGQVQGGDVNVTLNIRTEQPIDESYVRRTLVPTVKDEMRKASLRGEFILSSRGVRS